MDGAMEAPTPTEGEAVGYAASMNAERATTIVDDPTPATHPPGSSTSDGGPHEAPFDADDGDEIDWDAPVWIDRVWDRVTALGWRRIITFLTVAAATLLILSVLHPGLILRDTTPTGRDMGAHV